MRLNKALLDSVTAEAVRLPHTCCVWSWAQGPPLFRALWPGRGHRPEGSGHLLPLLHPLGIRGAMTFFQLRSGRGRPCPHQHVVGRAPPCRGSAQLPEESRGSKARTPGTEGTGSHVLAKRTWTELLGGTRGRVLAQGLAERPSAGSGALGPLLPSSRQDKQAPGPLRSILCSHGAAHVAAAGSRVTELPGRHFLVGDTGHACFPSW